MKQDSCTGKNLSSDKTINPNYAILPLTYIVLAVSVRTYDADENWIQQ
jgi:hypothetical protein